MLGPSVPQWAALAERLDALRGWTHATNAVVMDAFQDLWCRAQPLGEQEEKRAFDLLATALERHDGAPLNRGGKLEIVSSEAAPFFGAWSFAGIYVLLVWFEETFDEHATRVVVRHALPEIEALTVSLPPPDGPTDSSNAASKR